MPGPVGRSLPPLIQKSSPGDPGHVSFAGSAGRSPNPGILPVPWPCTPYRFPSSEPSVMNLIWSSKGSTHGGGALDVESLELELELDEPDEVVSIGVHGEGLDLAGNCRSTAPPHKLGPSAPQ